MRSAGGWATATTAAATGPGRATSSAPTCTAAARPQRRPRRPAARVGDRVRPSTPPPPPPRTPCAPSASRRTAPTRAGGVAGSTARRTVGRGRPCAAVAADPPSADPGALVVLAAEGRLEGVEQGVLVRTEGLEHGPSRPPAARGEAHEHGSPVAVQDTDSLCTTSPRPSRRSSRLVTPAGLSSSSSARFDGRATPLRQDGERVALDRIADAEGQHPPAYVEHVPRAGRGLTLGDLDATATGRRPSIVRSRASPEQVHDLLDQGLTLDEVVGQGTVEPLPRPGAPARSGAARRGDGPGRGSSAR